MFLPWSLITGRPKSPAASTSARRGQKQLKSRRRPNVRVEALEDRVVPANYFVDASFAGASTGAINAPFKTIQDALIAANANPGQDSVFVYGNTAMNSTSNPALGAYVWTRDEDANNDFIFDGNMDIGTDATNPVSMFFRASVLNPASPDGSGGAPANLIVKMRDNIVDVHDGSQLRIEGSASNRRVIFTSILDDSAGGDANGDGLINAPQRTNWGGIRFRAEAIDQGATSATGSLINFADLRYTGATVFDEVVGFPSEFGSIRMEANSTDAANVRSAQVRVWNTIFQHGGRALDININALGDGGKASSVLTGPDLGAATAQPLTFIDNSINGAFVFIPADFFTGFLQQLFVNTTLDDVGVPYVLTQRFVIGSSLTTPALPGFPGNVTLTFDPGTILKSQNTGLDGIDFGEPNDRTYGTIRVNGTVNRPVLFTSLTDDELIAGTDLPSLYNNGSADTNNDGDVTAPAPGDWGGIRIAQGNIDHALVRYAGGFTQVNGTFVNWPAIRVFARDLTPAGLNVQQVRVSNTEVTQTYSDNDPNSIFGVVDSPGIDLFSRDDGDTRFAGPLAPITRTGDVQIMDNNVHNNLGKAIQAHPLYFHDARNSLGGYGVYIARNIIDQNATNGVFIKFILDQSRGIDQNLPSVGSVFDDSDIVHVVDGQLLIVHPDQFFQMMSQRGVVPDQASGGYLQKFTDLSTFLSNLKLRLPGNLPTDLTKPMELPLQHGPIGVNNGLVDSGLFYYLTNFETTSRNASNAVGTTLRGEEWRDWGVNFVYPNDPTNLVDNTGLFPFVVSSDPNNATGRIFRTNSTTGDGTFEMVFPDQVSAIGFYINNNQVTSPHEKIELFAADGRLIDSAPLPTTGVNGRTYFARISKTPIYRVRITEDAGDNTAAGSVFTNNSNTAIPDNGAAVEIPINVGTSFTVADVNVSVNIVHPRAADLQLDLVAPNGTVVPLSKIGATTATGANYTNTYFDDSSSLSVDLGVAPFSGSYYPTSFDPFALTPTGLSVLNGINANGQWKLRVRDGRALNVGSVTNFTLTFKAVGQPLDTTGISGLAWVLAPSNLVVKANTADTVITAGSVRNGYGGITQDAAGVIVNGFVPQMTNNTTGTRARDMFTFGQNTNTSFSSAPGSVPLVNGGSTLIPIDVTSDFVPYDITVQLNLVYSSQNNQLRIRLRAPDGTEIDLVSAGAALDTGGFTDTTFDDRTELSLAETPQLTPPPNPPNFIPATVQSSSFSTTRTNNPSQTTPFGLSFFRGKNARGTWVLVIDKQNGQTGSFTDATINFRGMTGGWGSTLRILGQGNAPVILTGIQDDSAGAGPIGHIQFDNGSDGPTTATPGQWRGVQVLAGVNTNLSEVVSQNPNGTLNRRYADLNPYTRGDEGLTYPGITNTNGLLLSTQDDFHTALSAVNGGTTAATRAPFDVANRANVQDGTLIEYAEIRFAQTGIDQRGYPRNKMTIDGNEWEPSSSVPEDVESNGSTALVQPTPLFATNQLNQIRFETIDGTYKVAGRAGGTGDGLTTRDVDWYLLDNPGQTISMYIDVESGARTNGNDEPTNRKFAVAVYDSVFHLLWWSGQTGGSGYFTNPNAANAGNSLGPVTLMPGDQNFEAATGFARDARYIAVMPVGRVPRSFVDSQITDGQGQPPATWIYNFGAFPASPAGADGGTYTTFPVAGGDPTNPTNDWPWDPPGFAGVAPQGGYEMTLRMTGGERHLDSPRPADGQIMIRSNTITNSAGTGISLSDLRVPVTINSLGEDMPLQAARFPFNATNRATNNNGNPFRNEDVNAVNPQFSAPANFVPGPTVQNNLIIRNGGDGISLTENRLTNNVIAGPAGLDVANPVPYSSNTVTPTAFTQIFNNTIDGNAGNGISLTTRGGPTVNNNIVSNNSNGLSITDGYDILTNTPAVVPVVSYNIFFNNVITGTFTGANNIVGSTAAHDPQFIDPPINDYRVRVTSPAVDSAISDLQDRMRSSRFPQVTTRAPNLDLRGRARVDNSSRTNVGSGAFPFYDRGALETNELSLRVIGLSVLSDNGIIGTPLTTITITFAGRVDAATFNPNSVQIRRNTTTGTIVTYQSQLTSNTYDINADTHTWTLVFGTPLTDGTYWLLLDGTGSTTGLRDIAGQLMDGEFPVPYKLPSGNGSPGGSLQYPFTIRTGVISGNIWRNDNGNGTIDVGEPGIGSVLVVLNGAGDDGILFTGDDVIVDTATSSAGGAYSFTNLGTGRYYVTVDEGTLPSASYRLNTPPPAKVVNLPIGGVQANLNFGYWIDNGNIVVSGRVFNDLNGNGVANPGEPAAVPSGGVQVTLTSGGDDFNLATTGDNVTYTVVTDSNGNYSFQGTVLNPIYANNFRLDVDESLIPITFVRTSPVVIPVSFTLTPAGTRTQNYGYQEKQATISGLVFADADGSGSLTGGETGIANVNVSLFGAGIDGVFGTADDLATLNTTTNASGNYSFFPLTAGNYRVVVDSGSPALANFYLTTNNATQNLTLNTGTGTVNAGNVGYRQDIFAGQITGLVFNDLNGNGAFELGEPGIGGVNVRLRWAGRNGIVGDSDDQVYNALTNGAGGYSATNLPVGDFYVEPTTGIPAGFGLTTPAALPLKITLGFAGLDATNGFFGYIAADGSISGFVFNDVNGDGVAGGTETGRFGGVRVYIDANANSQFDVGERNAVSAAVTGVYTISNLPAGVYSLRIDTATLPASVPAGFAASTGTLIVNVPPSGNVTGRNLGLQQRNAQVSGFVFLDLNSNGAFDGNEVGSPGQTVTLTFTGLPVPANFTSPQTYTSNSDGSFSFTGLPAGSYRVESTAPTGGTIPAASNPQNFSLTAGASSSRLFPVQFTGSQSAGVWYMSFAGISTTLFNSDGSLTTVTETDIVRLTAPSAGVWQYDVFFRGSQFGLTGGTEAIDAFTFSNTGQVIISTKGTFAINTNYSGGFGSGTTITGFGEDLIRFTPSSPNAGFGLESGAWSLFFKGSRVGLSGASENVDAVSLVYNGTGLARILLSTAGKALVNGGVSANPQDVLSFKPTSGSSLGASTAGTFTKFFVGGSRGLNDPTQENVDALFYLPNALNSTRPTLFMSTAGNFNITSPIPLSGNSGDMLKFEASGGGPVGLLSGSFTSVALRGSDFGHGTANVTGFWLGATASDPDPLSPGGPGGPGFMSSLLMASSSVSDSSVSSLTDTSKKPASSSLLAKSVAAATGNSSSAVSSQADQFFATAKRQHKASAVNSLAKNLLARLS